MSVLDGPKTITSSAGGDVLAADGAPGGAVGRRRRPVRTLLRQPWPLVVGSTVLGIVVLVLVLTPWIAPSDPAQQDLTQRLAGSSAAHWLGTDQLGRDLLTRLMYGGRFSVTIAGITVAICAVLGTLVGILCARVRGAFDELVMRVCDVLLAFPEMIVAMFVVSILGASKTTLILALVVGGWTPFAKLARGVALEVDARGFIEAARA